MSTALQLEETDTSDVSGQFVTIDGERYYAIRGVDKMAPFFMSVISNVDHWLFVSSTGGLTAGRVSPETALFPYDTVDKIHDSALHTGCKTIIRVDDRGQVRLWEPFNREHDDRFDVSRNLYKNVLGNKLRFEEVNHDLGLAFRYTWQTSDSHGFVRACELENVGNQGVAVEFIDGLQNILPAGTPRIAQTRTSNLVDAYKWSELDDGTDLAMFTLYSGITDRAEPSESLKANVTYCLGLDAPLVLISSGQLDDFRAGHKLEQESQRRGIRGAYFVNHSLELQPRASQRWLLVADIELSQSEVVDLRQQLRDSSALADTIGRSVASGSEHLARIMARSDAFQGTAEEHISVHHYANVLFNVLRGGYFYNQYNVDARDFANTVRHFNRVVFRRNRALLDALPDELPFVELLSIVVDSADSQLLRLCSEYLPITFGRRHGDPSRPWNEFSINLRDGDGKPLLSYEGNWRDIFQNWEALAFSYPEFVENMIAKFVNASTMDGYNPYRITKQGIDWEVEEPDDPWSYIGYWGDHQIIYLQKLLELCAHFHPARLQKLLHRPVYCYANVPYRIRPFDALVRDNKNTVSFDEALAGKIEERVAEIGADGKLVLDDSGDVYEVTLLEKLLVPLLAKLGNFVIDGGIWLNTQRPEWNDANNALVGQGLSMVTLYYMRRYVTFLRELLDDENAAIDLSSEVRDWLDETAAALAKIQPAIASDSITSASRFALLRDLGQAASRYRDVVYAKDAFSGKVQASLDSVKSLLDDALVAIDHSIAGNVRDDGLYHAYNLLDIEDEELNIDTLYPMLEGQVAALSAGAVSPEQAVTVLEALFASDVYRADQHSFMLYPDRKLPAFLDKNRVPADAVAGIPLLQRMLDDGDDSLIVRDREGQHRFNADFANVADLKERLDSLVDAYGDAVDAAREPLAELFESVFNHQAFTGRSGTMFGFEGLGCIYWHMVSKLLLAVQENYFQACDTGADDDVCRQLAALYYRVREGIGFNKTPAEFGAFPTDPYSHTPKHSGARQPGMTGQVKEEILTRFGELGIRVSDGIVRFEPSLLRKREFGAEAREFSYLDGDGNWQRITVPENALAFTWCQVPVIYALDDAPESTVTLTLDDGETRTVRGRQLSADDSKALFRRSGRIRQVSVTFSRELLYAE